MLVWAWASVCGRMPVGAGGRGRAGAGTFSHTSQLLAHFVIFSEIIGHFLILSHLLALFLIIAQLIRHFLIVS